MHKREDLAKQMARQQSRTGWIIPLREKKKQTMGELNQLHMSLGKGHHLARSMGSHNRIWNRGRG